MSPVEAAPGAGPPARPKPTIAQLGIDLGALRWHRSGRGAGSFEVAFVGAANGQSPAGEAVAARRAAGPSPAGEALAARATASRAGYRADTSAQWVLLRVAGDPAARVLIYDRIEWESFVDGAAKGEFDAAAGLPDAGAGLPDAGAGLPDAGA